MVNALGVDPGTGSMDLLLLDDSTGSVLYEEPVPRSMVTSNPGIILEKIRSLARVYGVDSIAAPSGYGVPFKRDRDIVDYIMMATFIHEGDLKGNMQIEGLRRVMLELYNSGFNVYFTPGVVHLPTVPRHRKVNRIDMGTADKVFTVAAALYDSVAVRGATPGESTFIVVEAGKAYNAAIAVEGGAIIDGIGGTLGDHGFMGPGSLDAEVAYALASIEGSFSRRRLFEGGAGYLAGETDPERFTAMLLEGDPSAHEALEVVSESITRNVFRLLPSFKRRPTAIYVSGRLSRLTLVEEHIIGRLLDSLSLYGLTMEVRRVPRLGRETKEGATGAALLASGYHGGRHEWIVESLKLRESSGTVFDNVILGGLAEKAPSYFTRIGRDSLHVGKALR